MTLLAVRAAFFSLHLAICAGTASAAVTSSSDPPAAMVDGVAISRQSVITAVPSEDQVRRNAQLNAYVNEQVLANAARRDKLDVEVSVVSASETAQRQALARAYVAKRAAALGPVPAEDIKRYYEQHPELFAQRRIYRLQEIVVTAPPDRVAEITKRFASLKTFQDRVDWLEKARLPYTVGVVVMAAEELPADMLATVSKLYDGNAFNVLSERGITAVQITGLENKPLTLTQAQASIERFLANQRLGQVYNEEAQRLRRAAKVEYFAPFAASNR